MPICHALALVAILSSGGRSDVVVFTDTGVLLRAHGETGLAKNASTDGDATAVIAALAGSDHSGPGFMRTAANQIVTEDAAVGNHTAPRLAVREPRKRMVRVDADGVWQLSDASSSAHFADGVQKDAGLDGTRPLQLTAAVESQNSAAAQPLQFAQRRHVVFREGGAVLAAKHTPSLVDEPSALQRKPSQPLQEVAGLDTVDTIALPTTDTDRVPLHLRETAAPKVGQNQSAEKSRQESDQKQHQALQHKQQQAQQQQPTGIPQQQQEQRTQQPQQHKQQPREQQAQQTQQHQQQQGLTPAPSIKPAAQQSSTREEPVQNVGDNHTIPEPAQQSKANVDPYETDADWSDASTFGAQVDARHSDAHPAVEKGAPVDTTATSRSRDREPAIANGVYGPQAARVARHSSPAQQGESQQRNMDGGNDAESPVAPGNSSDSADGTANGQRKGQRLGKPESNGRSVDHPENDVMYDNATAGDYEIDVGGDTTLRRHRPLAKHVAQVAADGAKHGVHDSRPTLSPLPSQVGLVTTGSPLVRRDTPVTDGKSPSVNVVSSAPFQQRLPPKAHVRSVLTTEAPSAVPLKVGGGAGMAADADKGDSSAHYGDETEPSIEDDDGDDQATELIDDAIEAEPAEEAQTVISVGEPLKATPADAWQVPEESDVLRLGEGVGSLAYDRSPTSSRKLNKELRRRLVLQDCATIALLVIVFWITVFVSCYGIYQVADDPSPVLFYSDPRDHQRRLTCSSTDVDNFLQVFNAQPQNARLRIIGKRNEQESLRSLIHQGRWSEVHRLLRSRAREFLMHIGFIRARQRPWDPILFDVSLDLTPFIAGEGRLSTAEDLILLQKYIASNNSLEVVSLLKRVEWASWEDVATNIRQRLRTLGFMGEVEVRFEAHEEVVIYRNHPWQNFVRSRITQALVLISVVGSLVWLPYLWMRVKKVKVHATFEISLDLQRYWDLFSGGLHPTEGFVGS